MVVSEPHEVELEVSKHPIKMRCSEESSEKSSLGGYIARVHSQERSWVNAKYTSNNKHLHKGLGPNGPYCSQHCAMGGIG